MERYFEKSEIRWLPLTIFVAGYCRYLFKTCGYHLDRGMVLVTDSEIQARQFITLYCEGPSSNGVLINNRTRKKKHPENFQVGLLVIQKQSIETEIEDFLSEGGFLPIAVCGGILPEYLRENHYIFRVHRKDLEEMSNSLWWENINKLCSFIIENPLRVCERVRRIERMDTIPQCKNMVEMRYIFRFLQGVFMVYSEYLIETEMESKVKEFMGKYCKEMLCRIEGFVNFASGEEITRYFSELVWEYLLKHSNVLVSSEEDICGKETMALEKENIIFFDEKFYFFPLKLLMKICEPLLQNKSEPELKKLLKSEGILYCNSSDYTVKKTLTNVYGAKVRPRFLWVYKEYLLSPDNLRLEDVFLKEKQRGANE